MYLCNQKLLYYILDRRRSLVLEPENSGQYLKLNTFLKNRLYVGQDSHRYLCALQILLEMKLFYLCISKMNFKY